MIPDINHRDLELTAEEQRLLDWLATEDTSTCGECNGLALDHLVETGLAEIVPTHTGTTIDPRYNRVRLTQLGRERAR
jgi:hypothetical protein